MRKLLIAFLAVALLFSGCASDPEDVLEIGERFFVNQTLSIVLNQHEYVGRMVRYEGIFATFPDQGTDTHLVYRYVPGCCSPSGIVGFIVEIGDLEPLPTNAWAEVEGVFEEFIDHNGHTSLRVAATSLRELEERGSELVRP
ncbi:MAG: hypothetical protein FWC91_01160 [Defluviitaleaceae bacterium]|nr:hypothetical protein [Defluviitaleaceae bacterium]